MKTKKYPSNVRNKEIKPNNTVVSKETGSWEVRLKKTYPINTFGYDTTTQKELIALVIKEISQAIKSERDRWIEAVDKASVEMDELIKPLSGHCGQCDASVDGWNSAVDVIQRGLKDKLNIK
jgi:hypothetical protein